MATPIASASSSSSFSSSNAHQLTAAASSSGESSKKLKGENQAFSVTVRGRPMATLALNIEEVVTEAMSFLSLTDVVSMKKVCKLWNVWGNSESVWNDQCDQQGIPPMKEIDPKTGREALCYLKAYKFLDPIIFGPRQWSTYYADPHGKVVPLGADIYDTLARLDPQQQKKFRVRYLPKEVSRNVANGQTKVTAVTPNLLGELAKTPRKGFVTCYDPNSWKTAFQQQGETAVESSYWYLEGIDVVDKTRKEPYETQVSIVAQSGFGLRAPRFIEASFLNFSEHVRFGTFPQGSSPWTYTRVETVVMHNNTGYHLVVGSFAPSGLFVDVSDFVIDYVGIAAAFSCGSSAAIGT
jgi:hypothetical protein